MSVFRVSIYSWVNFPILYLWGICPFHLNHLFAGIKLYNTFSFYRISGDVPSFISNFDYLYLLIFFISLARGLSILLIFQRTNSDFLYCFSVFYFITFHLELYHILPAAHFGFILFLFFLFLKVQAWVIDLRPFFFSTAFWPLLYLMRSHLLIVIFFFF